MIYNTLKEAYVGHLSKEETIEVAQFAAEMQRAYSTNDMLKVAQMLNEVCAQIQDFDTLEKIANLSLHCQNHGQEKVAFAGAMLNAALVGLTAAPYVREGIERRQNPKDFDASIKAVYNSRPDFFTPDKYDLTMRYFNTLTSFAPDVAKNPMFTANVLDRYHRMGPALMDMNVIKELTTTQSSITDSRAKSKSTLDPKQDIMLLMRKPPAKNTGSKR